MFTRVSNWVGSGDNFYYKGSNGILLDFVLVIDVIYNNILGDGVYKVFF